MSLEKLSKDEAQYTLIPQRKVRCELCKNYKPVSGTSPRSGLCEQVWGIVEEKASCAEFLSIRGGGSSETGRI